ncbi:MULTISPECIES: hypothetical protein [unclassified Pseudomonas]|uniref:hypothetical protein n=1 Tax=unclassified Pseudomonas TaxID=196821 RepID=UPI000BA41681|nr:MULTISPECIES: hypothetical protein [unclassified Pseudomonas]
MSLLKKPATQWVVLGLINAACIYALISSPISFKKNVGYHTNSHQWLEDQNQLNTEEYLTIGEDRLTLSAIESLNGKLRNATVSADIIRSNQSNLEIKIASTKLSQDSELFAIDKMPDLFFRRQYIGQEGSTLNYSFLPTSDDNTVCFYLHEFGRLRCMNN